MSRRNEHDLTAPSPQPVGRRTLLKGAAWAVPVIAFAAPAPAFAASQAVLPQFMGLNDNIGVYPDNVQGDPRAYAYGTPGVFTPEGDHYIIVTITASAGAGVSLTSLDNAGTLNGWVVWSSSPTVVQLRWPTKVTGNGFNTVAFLWYWTGTAAAGSISVTGAITNTPITNFDEGTQVGP